MNNHSFLYTLVVFLFFFGFCNHACAQELPVTTGQQLEDLAATSEEPEPDDDQWLQVMEQYRRHPLNLNQASEQELLALHILTPQQVYSLLAYRKLLGPLVHVYELQAVPGWYPELVRKLMPIITVAQTVPPGKAIGQRLSGGDHTLLLRVSQVLERPRGYYDSTTTGNYYPGSAQRLLFRYKYMFRNNVQYGLTAEKDPGEAFFSGKQKTGFDFYSAHLFVRELGKVKAMALGDFTVNLGQGLVQWQSLAFRKSADALAVKRYSPVLRPYNSTGEANFLRGAGITLGLGKHVEATVFGSLRRRDARLEASSVAGNEPVVTSLYTSGYHRTHSEWESRNRLRIAQWGGSARFSKRNIQVGVHGVASRFSSPLEKNDAPHNRYAIRGKSWWNLGIDYSYTYQNLHFFGETAAGRNGHIATVNGLMMSLDARLDAAIVWRSIAPQYQTLNGNAFTESTMPNNERGFYAGVTVRPWTGIRIDAYADNWYFPFMRYQVHGPAQGSDYLLQVLFKPNKQVEWYIRYRTETREQNSTVPEGPVYPLTAVPRQNLRAHVAYKINPAITLFQRAEMVWVNRGASNGFTVYAELVYQPQLKPFSANMRVQYFETTDYSSRVYAYEHDVLYSYSVPALYGKGARYYANVQYDITRRLSFWFRWSQTIYREQETIGSGLDELPGNRRSEFRVQARWVF